MRQQTPKIPRRLPTGLLPLACLMVFGGPWAFPRLLLEAAEPVDYARQVKPLLAARCYGCHGEQKQKGGLRLDRKADLFAITDSGHSVIQPGKSIDSELSRRIASTDDSEWMPPEGPRFTAAEVAIIKNWIDAGAVVPDDSSVGGPKHWAYLTPKQDPLPEVQRRAWVRNGLDHFVLTRLEKEGLAPAAEAEKATLLRRVALDLVGLPPSPADVARFLDDVSPDAFERAVDRLLASPRFGERWARLWLDLARYADTQGYEKDNRRSIWPYRDWLIRALNADLPFDRFTIEQLAGDMLPNATDDQRVATGFHRNTMTNTEGGTDNEEFRYEAVVDRVNTTFAVWMGTTFNCAQCHNHKYDPFSTVEYYRVMAYLDNTEDADHDNESPTMKVFGKGQAQQLQALRRLQKMAEQRWNDATKMLVTPANLDTWAKQLTPADIDKLPKELRDILQVETSKRDAGQQQKLRQHYQNVHPELRKLHGDMEKARKAANDFDQSIPTTSVMVERPHPRVTKRHVRGSYLTTAEEVTPGTPASLHPFPSDAPANRLGFARWLVARDNPLTARVIVNRFWEQLFGRGLVVTSEEFGKQGERPTHPELLDWLAVEFMRGAESPHRGEDSPPPLPWSMKAFLRLVVTSATYRQDSRIASAPWERDPDNRLLARGPRFRLEAEMIRDQALAIAGLLSPKMGGPSVMPYQPDGIWQVVYSGDQWQTSPGEDKYRRGLYTFWRRSSPHPMMMNFDAPSREFCVLKRSRSNTPLQALNTLNDPTFIEAAQALARRVIVQPGNRRDQLAFAVKRCLIRAPRAEEMDRLEKLFQGEWEYYRANPKAAEQMATQPLGKLGASVDLAELAAWTVVCNVLMNLDEIFVKG